MNKHAHAGTTSQPSMGAIVGALRNTPQDTGLAMEDITAVNEYWEECRGLYAPFEVRYESVCPSVSQSVSEFSQSSQEACRISINRSVSNHPRPGVP